MQADDEEQEMDASTFNEPRMVDGHLEADLVALEDGEPVVIGHVRVEHGRIERYRGWGSGGGVRLTRLFLVEDEVGYPRGQVELLVAGSEREVAHLVEGARSSA